MTKPFKKILFLGYSPTETKLINHLQLLGHEVTHSSSEIDDINDFDIAISFGYRHIIKRGLLEKISFPIVNLHISLLPWNRGSHPNFWSFYDDTPIGVSVHLIDLGIDTGPIICQRTVVFYPHEDTFLKTYKRLLFEVEQLFLDNLDTILSTEINAFVQPKGGTFHKVGDLPKEFSGWNSNIAQEIRRLKFILNTK